MTGRTGHLSARWVLVGLALAGAAATTLLVSILGSPTTAHAERGLELGVSDPIYEDGSAAERDTWFGKTESARAGVVLLEAKWRDIAPTTRPATFNAKNPADPAYSWGQLDAAVRDAAAHGLKVMLLVNSAPRWAEGPHRPGPQQAPVGTWKPSPGALADFGQAIARRYSGTFRDPTSPLKQLPRVRLFQLWAEANLIGNLTPQASAPDHYRDMLNGFYKGVKAVSSKDDVVTSGLAPYGDHPPSRFRTPPVLFWRGLLCLKGAKLRPVKCKNPAHFDVAAHNPINVGAPTRHAISKTDASTPDLGRITRVIHKAARTGRVKPKGHKPLFATEEWWDSKPPDPRGVPEAKQARWLEQSLQILWRQGASMAVWFLARDQAPDPNYASTFQTGLFFHDGKPKLAYHAYRFPFVANRHGKHGAGVWGKAPQAGKVRVQVKHKGHWRTIKTVNAGSSRVFTARVGVTGRTKLRADQGAEQSLGWPLGR